MSRAVNLVDVSMFDGSRYSFWSFVGEGFDLETLDELRSIEEDEITTGEGGRRASELSEVPVPGTAMGDTPESATVQGWPWACPAGAEKGAVMGRLALRGPSHFTN